METARLLLTAPATGDAATIFRRYASDPEVVDAWQVVTGYVLARDAWGNGYATEVLSAMVDLARGLGFERLTAECHHQHQASWRVLEKCGFMRDNGMRQTKFPNLLPGVQQAAFSYTKRLMP